MLVRTHDGAVDEDFLEVDVFAQNRKDVVPVILGGAAGKSNIGAVPGARLCREIALRTSWSGNPHDCLDKEAVIGSPTAPITGLTLHQLLDAYPLIIPQYHS